MPSLMTWTSTSWPRLKMSWIERLGPAEGHATRPAAPDRPGGHRGRGPPRRSSRRPPPRRGCSSSSSNAGVRSSSISSASSSSSSSGSKSASAVEVRLASSPRTRRLGSSSGSRYASWAVRFRRRSARRSSPSDAREEQQIVFHARRAGIRPIRVESRRCGARRNPCSRGRPARAALPRLVVSVCIAAVLRSRRRDRLIRRCVRCRPAGSSEASRVGTFARARAAPRPEPRTSAAAGGSSSGCGGRSLRRPPAGLRAAAPRGGGRCRGPSRRALFAVGRPDRGPGRVGRRAAAVVALLVEQVAVVRRLDVGDVQEAVAADAEIDERRLDARLDVDDAALVDVADVALVAGPLDVQLFQHAVLDDGDAALLGLQDVDEHFLLHAFPLFGGVRGEGSGTECRGRQTLTPAPGP